jgi:mono/diheme cytochrome c family protein
MNWFGARTIGFLLVFGLLFLSCSDSSTSPANAPEGHTTVQGGVPHAPGLTDPIPNCSACHGATLQGGAAGQPSCFSCHGQKW